MPTQEPTPPLPAAQNVANTEENLSATVGTDTETPAAPVDNLVSGPDQEPISAAAPIDNLVDAKPLSNCTLIELFEAYIRSYRRIRDIQDEPEEEVEKAYAFHEAIYDEISAHFLANEELKNGIAKGFHQMLETSEEDYLKQKAQAQLEALHSARAVQVEEETVAVLSDTRER